MWGGEWGRGRWAPIHSTVLPTPSAPTVMPGSSPASVATECGSRPGRGGGLGVSHQGIEAPPHPKAALEVKGPQRRPRKRLDRRLEEVAKAVGGGSCRLQMPLKLALASRETVAGHRLASTNHQPLPWRMLRRSTPLQIPLEGGGGPPFPCTPPHGQRQYQGASRVLCNASHTDGASHSGSSADSCFECGPSAP